jgi:hypothetical protein
MSHIVTIKTEFRSLPAIEAACKRLGWAFSRNQRTYKWFGDWIGDSSLPEELFTPEQLTHIKRLDDSERQKYMTEFMGNCDHAITVPGCSYEIGVLEVRCKEGGKKFVLAYDYWPSGGLHTKMPTKPGDPNPFAQAYAIEAAKAQAIIEGYSVEESTLANGTMVLTLGDSLVPSWPGSMLS